jgi:hypothetical protein
VWKQIIHEKVNEGKENYYARAHPPPPPPPNTHNFPINS